MPKMTRARGGPGSSHATMSASAQFMLVKLTEPLVPAQNLIRLCAEAGYKEEHNLLFCKVSEVAKFSK